MSKIVVSSASADSLEPTDVRASAGTMMITFGPYMYTGPALDGFNTLRLEENCRHFAEDILKCILLN